MKKGSAWLLAAAVSGAVVLLSGIELWADKTPPIGGGPGGWDLFGLVRLMLLLYGVPCTAVLAFVGLTLRLGLRPALWIAGTLLLALILML